MDKGSIIGVKLDCDRETFEFTMNDRMHIFQKRTIGFSPDDIQHVNHLFVYVDGERLWYLHHELPQPNRSIIGVRLDCDRGTLELTVNDRKYTFEKRTIGLM
ncbi:unnamed protein product [Nippostrongylus brasiliensis]|uniref:B30.2/SPRY domain-containing protein n=1 Tax=Nippostrongylus brasiliensis TaxID=27835 RepID=A0A0N4XHZ5_NIPBR|nr:unnamed protein product [Nippostrongylus brasiliensis]